MDSIEIEERVLRAKDLFTRGYNCSQAVFASCADLYGIEDQRLALRIAASFGGGIGRMRLTCGAASGMFLLAGLKNGSYIEGDADGKKQNYALVQELAQLFKNEYGSITCAELLGIASVSLDPTPAPRNVSYYQKRPCVEMVEGAVRIYLNHTEHNK